MQTQKIFPDQAYFWQTTAHPSNDLPMAARGSNRKQQSWQNLAKEATVMNMSRWRWFFAILSRRLWVRASIYGVLAVFTALVSIYIERYIPENIPRKIGADAVDGILHILASSMLAVTIFSLSTMVSA